jgi:glycosyltransferase involved in cell wall biosynthesis
MLKISVAIITLNEERNIKRCLESVQSIANEIVIVDSGSSDATQIIAQDYPAKFIVHPFEGHIQQKNYALQCCVNEWVLSLDADEALSEDLCNSIKDIQEDDNAIAYSMNRLTNYYGKWIRYGGWYPDKKIRLFKKSNAKWGGENPHDKIIITQKDSVRHLKGDILHYSFYTFLEHRKQVIKFSQIAANQRILKNKAPSFLQGCIHGGWSFIRSFIFSIGFLDGMRGYNIARMAALYSFRKYTLNRGK